MYPRHPEPSKNQLWYVDYTGYIKSLMNNMVFTSDGMYAFLISYVIQYTIFVTERILNNY